jgi:hypothetical protein
VDLGLEALRVGLARYARVRLECGQPDAEHRAEERGARRGQRCIVGGRRRGQERDTGECRFRWVCAGLGGAFPCVGRCEAQECIAECRAVNNVNCIQGWVLSAEQGHCGLSKYDTS